MQQPQSPAAPSPSIWPPAIRFGIILGIVYSIVAIVDRFASHLPRGLGLISVLGWIAGIVLLLIVGATLASRGASLGRATLAGMAASGIAWLIDGIVVIVLLVVSPNFYLDQAITAARQAARITGRPVDLGRITFGYLLVSQIIGLIVLLVIALALGALFGVLGGLIGRTRQTALPPTPYQETMYSGMGGYPQAGYPPAGAPPQQQGEWPRNPPPAPPPAQ